MPAQQLLQEPRAIGECGLATLLQTEFVEQESWGTACNSVDMLEKVSETENQGQEAMK